MAHMIETMFSVRELPWHYEMTKDVTKIIQEAPNSAEAIKYAGLDWEVVGNPIYDQNGVEIKGFKANTRNTDKSVLGIVSDRYQIVQNKEAFEFTDSLLENKDIRYETAGSLRNGKQVWLLAKMPTVDILGDDVDPYICFTNTHDGSGAIKVCMTPTRVVCNNTLNLALDHAKRSWSTKHMGDIASKLHEAQETLGLANMYMDELSRNAEIYANNKITDAQIEQILDEIFPVDFDKDSQRKINNVKEMKDSFYMCYMMPDIEKFKGTQYGVINAMADLADHISPNRNTSTYRENNWGRIMNGHPFLDNLVKKLNAMNVAV